MAKGRPRPRPAPCRCGMRNQLHRQPHRADGPDRSSAAAAAVCSAVVFRGKIPERVRIRSPSRWSSRFPSSTQQAIPAIYYTGVAANTLIITCNSNGLFAALFKTAVGLLGILI